MDKHISWEKPHERSCFHLQYQTPVSFCDCERTHNLNSMCECGHNYGGHDVSGLITFKKGRCCFTGICDCQKFHKGDL